MAKIDVDFGALMGQKNLSITTSPFAPGKIILKRASFPKGEVPPHLVSYLIPPGTGRGLTGKSVYKGKLIPNTAVNVAQRRGRNNG